YLMENNNKDQKGNSRRSFIRNFGLTLGIGAIATGGAVFTASKVQKRKGEKVKVLAQDGSLVEVDSTQLTPLPLNKQLADNQKRGKEGIPGKKWVMVIDLSKCRNARKCMAACQEAHHLRPEQHHINTLRMQESEDTAPYFMPKNCFHCDNPPCTKVCPVNATWKRQDGIVLINNERCIGCRFCMAACPYSARIFNWQEPLKVEGDDEKAYDIELNVPQKKGTISKCLFSADRLREGKLPYCVSSCPNGVYYFGNINEDAVTNGTTGETVKFSELIEKNSGYTVMPELGTKPQVFYLPPKNRLFPYEYNGENTGAEELHG
ncbi:4Fe-4S dicluster domain-containing protein, partial [Bacteroidota bacterium]